MPRFSWRDLIGEPPLCEGGRLASIVFCCDPRVKPCPVLDEALRILGISRESFIEVMERERVDIDVIDGTCYGNLAFCPSLEKQSRDRDEALRKLGWSVSDYLKYKYRLLTHLIPRSQIRRVFTERILRQYAVEVLDLESKKVYRAFALGNISSGFLRISEVFREGELRDRQVEEVIARTEFVGVRIPKELLSELDALIKKGIVKSRSDGIRRALVVYLSALKTPMKSVKQGL